jgi:hypothetical protein
MQVTEKQEVEQFLIIDYIRCAIRRLCYSPREWKLNFTHEIQDPHPDPDGSLSAAVPYEEQCIRYRAWVRAALEELYVALDEYNKRYEGYRNRNKYFNMAARLAYKSYKSLAFQDLTDPLVANSKRMRLLADMYEVERLLRRDCGFEGMFDEYLAESALCNEKAPR